MAKLPKKHVALVGLMGSGKTTVGRRVAKRLGYEFVDADEELAQRTDRSVREWFVHDGEEAFREAETWLLAELLDAKKPTVVATGGGVVVTNANRKRLRRDDVTVVWLRGTPKFLANRVAQRASRRGHRPLLDGDPLATLKQLNSERADWYADVADLVIDIDPVHEAEDRPKRRLAEMVEDALRAHAADGKGAK
ncbi:MAG: shikimate kinase [Acidimicrobiales bacterium]